MGRGVDALLHVHPGIETRLLGLLPRSLVGFSYRWSLPYRAAEMAPVVKRIRGFWGEPTSTLDWCEENYVVTSLVAEFWNTISNWIMIVPPLLGLLLTWQMRRETRYFCAFLSLFMVGIGSLCFHATLLFEMQLLDELPMIYGTCVFIFCLAECDSDSRAYNIALIAGLFATSSLITVIYITIKNPLLFQWAYGVLVACLVVQGISRSRKYQCSKKLLVISLSSYATGFILWNIENNFCTSVRYLRTNAIGPLQPLTQLHAIWHILAGIGSYYHILFSLNLRMRCRGYKTGLVLVWGWLPFIITKDKAISSSDNNNSQKTSKFVSISLYQIVWNFTRSF